MNTFRHMVDSLDGKKIAPRKDAKT